MCKNDELVVARCYSDRFIKFSIIIMMSSCV